MNNSIQRFDFKGAALRTLTDENGEPWFVAKDVCDVLELSNVGQALARLDNDEKSSITLNDGTPGNPNRAIVSESGLYALVLASRKPEAHEFKRWVTHEVLPQIRKTGGYIPTSDDDDDMTILAKAVMIGQRTMEEQKRRIAAQESHIKELEPKAKALDDFTNVPDALLVRDAAKLLSNSGTRIGEHELRQWLVDNGWIYRQSNQSWCAASSRVRQGHMVMVSSRSHGIHKDGTPFAYPPTPKLTRKGLALIHQRLSEQSFEQVLDAEVAA
jgi:anti-repressor protein